MGTPGFSDLLHQAQQLTADMEVGSELPRVERSLIQIKDAAHKMAYRTPPISGDATDVKASLLLGSRGYDMTKVSQKLESLNRTKTFEPLEPIRDVDIEAFLRNEHENAMLAAAEHTRNSTFEEASQIYMDSLECEWEKEKQKVLNSLVEMGNISFEFDRDQNTLDGSVAFDDDRSSRFDVSSGDVVAGYDIVAQYNESVINGGQRRNFSSMFVEFYKKHDQVMTDLWVMVQTLIDACIPAKATLSFRTSTQFHSSLVSGAVSYLEKSFLRHIEKMVSCNLQQAQRGGIPGTYNLIRGYFNIRRPFSPVASEDGILEGHPVWALIYFCIRCGDAEAIQQVVEKSRKLIGDFASVLSEYARDRKLSPDAERAVKLQYRRNVSLSPDPYKKLVYCVVGRCDPQDDHGEVSATTDDYLWLKLSQLSSELDQEVPEHLTLTKFQHLIENFGESHFMANQQPLLYFKILMMTGQFESAVEFLSRFDAHKSVAVHVALVLYESHLVLLTINPHAQLLMKDDAESSIRRLNLARIITTFARRFELNDPQKAINYYFFLREATTSTGENLFMSCVCDIVMATREFDLLLGQLQVDGTRKPGLIDKFKVDSLKVIEKVAQESEVKGQLNDSVILYDLASNHNKVIELLNKLLSQILSQSASSKLNKDIVKKLALSVADRYNKQNLSAKIDHSSMTTFHLLLDISSFFDCYHGNKYEEAYGIMRDLDFLAFSEEVIEDKVKNFCAFSDEVRRCLPDILLATMSTLVRFCKDIGPTSTGLAHKQSVFSNLVVTESSKANLLRQYKSQAHALVSFSGSMPYRMPADTTARLVHMEASIK